MPKARGARVRYPGLSVSRLWSGSFSVEPSTGPRLLEFDAGPLAHSPVQQDAGEDHPAAQGGVAVNAEIAVRIQ